MIIIIIIRITIIRITIIRIITIVELSKTITIIITYPFYKMIYRSVFT